VRFDLLTPGIDVGIEVHGADPDGNWIELFGTL
jgi:hypothetical protein